MSYELDVEQNKRCICCKQMEIMQIMNYKWNQEINSNQITNVSTHIDNRWKMQEA